MYSSPSSSSSNNPTLTSVVLKSITARLVSDDSGEGAKWSHSTFPGVDILSNGKATFTVASGEGFPKRLKVLLTGERSEPRLLAEARLDEHRIESWLETVLGAGLTAVRAESAKRPSLLEQNRVKEMAFRNSIAFLSNLIAGREHAEQPVRPQVFGAKTIGVIRLPVGESLVKFKIHADSRCSAIQKFLERANPENLSVVRGPSGGSRLGVDGQVIDHLYIYA